MTTNDAFHVACSCRITMPSVPNSLYPAPDAQFAIVVAARAFAEVAKRRCAGPVSRVPEQESRIAENLDLRSSRGRDGRSAQRSDGESSGQRSVPVRAETAEYATHLS